MTKLLYHTDSYLRRFQALVTDVVGQGVVPDRTAFYPAWAASLATSATSR